MSHGHGWTDHAPAGHPAPSRPENCGACVYLAPGLVCLRIQVRGRYLPVKPWGRGCFVGVAKKVKP